MKSLGRPRRPIPSRSLARGEPSVRDRSGPEEAPGSKPSSRDPVITDELRASERAWDDACVDCAQLRRVELTVLVEQSPLCDVSGALPSGALTIAVAKGG